MPGLVWTNFAVSELKAIYLYHRMIAGQKVADKIRQRIFKTTKLLTKQPELGAIEPNLQELKQNYRYLISGNYKIIYKYQENTIYIIDVFDCRQNPQKMTKTR